jgi:hypothetical protein
MKMKRVFYIFVLGSIMVILSACGGSVSSSAQLLDANESNSSDDTVSLSNERVEESSTQAISKIDEEQSNTIPQLDANESKSSDDTMPSTIEDSSTTPIVEKEESQESKEDTNVTAQESKEDINTTQESNTTSSTSKIDENTTVADEPSSSDVAWLSIENSTLGSVEVRRVSEVDSQKAQYQIDIRGNNEDIHWIIKNNGTVIGEDSTQKIVNIDVDETIEIVFIDQEIERLLEGTTFYYRYDYEWDKSYDEAFLVSVYETTLLKVSSSSIMQEVLENKKVYLLADATLGYVGSTNTQKIDLNTYKYNRYTLERMVGAYIHELGHAYEIANSDVSKRVKTIYQNATWHTPTEYYNTNYEEMFACAVTEFFYSGNEAAHSIADEPYYQSVIEPYLQSLFTLDK